MGLEYTTEMDYIEMCIQWLREKLEEDLWNAKIILSEWEIGYRFVGVD